MTSRFGEAVYWFAATMAALLTLAAVAGMYVGDFITAIVCVVLAVPSWLIGRSVRNVLVGR